MQLLNDLLQSFRQPIFLYQATVSHYGSLRFLHYQYLSSFYNFSDFYGFQIRLSQLTFNTITMTMLVCRGDYNSVFRIIPSGNSYGLCGTTSGPFTVSNFYGYHTVQLFAKHYCFDSYRRPPGGLVGPTACLVPVLEWWVLLYSRLCCVSG